MVRRSLLVSTAMVALAACQSKHPDLTPLPDLTGNAGVASPRINGTVVEPNKFVSNPTIDESSPAAIRTPGAPRSAEGDVSLNFADTDIREIVRQVLGEILKLNYSIDPSVRGTATIETRRPLPRSELLSTLEALLNQSGATLVEQGNLYRVVPTAVAAATPSFGSAATTGSQIYPLRFASAKELQKVLEPYVGEGARVWADTSRNAIVVTGDPVARQAIQSLIQSFDVDTLAGESYALFPVNSGDPGKVATELQKIFQTEDGGGLAGIVRIIPMERVNAVLVVSPQPRYLDDAKRLFRLIERGQFETARTWHVYYVQNGQSADIANVLQRAFTPNNVTAVPSAGSIAPGQGQSSFGGTAGGSSPFGGSSSGGSTGSSGSGSGLGSSSGSSLGGLGSGSSGGLGQSGSSGTSGQPGQLQVGGGGGTDEGSSPAAEALSAPSSGEGGKENENSIRIIPNKTNNAILVYATPSEESTIESMLHKIDILPLQVRIDATIAEVTLTDDLKYGTQFTFKGGGVLGLLTSASGGTQSNIAGTTPGFSIAKIGSANNAQLVLSALADVTNVRVLSSPQILVLDNQAARLQVGNLVPYLTQTSQSTLTTTSQIVSSIDYRETGVILEVVPRVSTGGVVSLDISQEVSDATTTSSSTIDSPTFDERKIQSRVVVQDGQTIGLAGLIRDTVSRENAGIPFLKDIPILGALAGTQTNTRDRTELLVLLTPHVMQDQRQARDLTEDLRQKLLGAGLVPQELQDLPAQGSSNPNAKLTR